MVKNISDVQLAYNDAWLAVLEVRAQRQALYGDKWKEDADWELFAEIKQKTKRLESFIINLENKDANLYEDKKDNLIDLVNYSLFLLQNIIEREK